MKYKKFKIIYWILPLMFLFGVTPSLAQQTYVEGFVYERDSKIKKSIPLPGATVYWSNSNVGTTTSGDGSYKLELSGQFPVRIVVSFVGYQSDTLLIEKTGSYNFFLNRSVALEGVTIEGKQESTMISTIKTINVEQVNQKELLKAACCNLSESFETNPSVNVSYTDAITGAKEIQMLGLSGIYSQIMTENMPSIRGLSGTYGLAYVPGPWMESIQITKGSGSVANGFESTTGQINVEYLKPENSDNFYINGYGASTGNTELNVHKTFKVSEQANTILMLHGENMNIKWDHQDDNFLDMPLMHNYNLFNRWSVSDGKKFEGQFGVKVLNERRRSGQTFYDWGETADTTSGYGVQIKTKRIEAFSKTGLIFPKTPWRSAGLILSGSFHDQESYFGFKTYDGTQGSFYGSLIYMSIIRNTNHKWKAGIDLRYDDYREKYLLLPFNRIESVPGIYAEYTLSLKEKIGMIAGARADYHNEWGWFYTPRIHLKYNFTPEIIVRLSGGRSFRTANVFADNIGIMASSRNLLITEGLKPERAWNYGGNFIAKFRLFYRPGSFSVDYYITDFSNQVIVDTYTSANEILLYNLDGTSYSNSFQIVLNYEVFKRFEVRLAYKNDQVIMNYQGTISQKPLVPVHRALVNWGYTSRNEAWRYDYTLHYQGKSKLASSTENAIIQPGHEETQVKQNTAPNFYTMNAQVTRVLNKKWEVYLGGENLTGFRQKNPVMNAQDPFGPDFDATNIWGPVMGTKIYVGFRFKIPKKDS